MNFIFLIAVIAYGGFIWTAYGNARAGGAPLAPVGLYYHIAYKWWWTGEMRVAVIRFSLVLLLWMFWHRLT